MLAGVVSPPRHGKSLMLDTLCGHFSPQENVCCANHVQFPHHWTAMKLRIFTNWFLHFSCEFCFPWFPGRRSSWLDLKQKFFKSGVFWRAIESVASATRVSRPPIAAACTTKSG
eukprot:PhF_6_TR37333/c0_g1_i1/m.54978